MLGWLGASSTVQWCPLGSGWLRAWTAVLASPGSRYPLRQHSPFMMHLHSIRHPSRPTLSLLRLLHEFIYEEVESCGLRPVCAQSGLPSHSRDLMAP